MATDSKKFSCTRRAFARSAVSTLALGTFGAAGQGQSPQQKSRPNILFIIADDLGQQCGCYGDSVARTPNIDRLASEGVLFENAYVTTSICSPSRASMSQNASDES